MFTFRKHSTCPINKATTYEVIVDGAVIGLVYPVVGRTNNRKSGRVYADSARYGITEWRWRTDDGKTGSGYKWTRDQAANALVIHVADNPI